MAKKNNKIPVSQTKLPQEPVIPQAPVADSVIPSWLYSFKVQAIIIAALAFSFYINTVKNEYALDDLIVIVQNEYVYEGFAGIPDIFSKDAFDSYCRQANSTNQLSGGRYRPLSIATFAAEQQFLGPVSKSQADSVIIHAREAGPQENMLLHNMHVRHFFNVLWYTLAVVVLLYFLRQIVFENNPLMAFITAILFTVHPIHTEVVANVKSRDEIMSLLFVCTTFIFAFRYRDQNKTWMLGAALLSYLLALLSKEYAIAMVALLPIAFSLFRKYPLSKSLAYTVPYIGVLVLYLFIRHQAIGLDGGNPDSTDVWNNPYALAVGTEKLATEIATTLNYLKLLIFPGHLSADYSYNVIPYKSFANPLVWLSLIVHLSLIGGFFYFFKKRHVLAFAIAFYMLNLLMICNIIYNIGGTMGERLIYHSSLGFAIALSYLLVKGFGMIRQKSTGNMALAGCVIIIVVLSGFKTIDRNNDWKNDFTLFSHDIHEVPNSVLVNTNLGVAILSKVDETKDETIKIDMLHRGIGMLNKAILIDSVNIPAYLNEGLAYFKLKEPDSARNSYDKVVSFIPNYQRLPEMYYNVGVLYYFNKRYTDAINVWQRVLKLQPSYLQAQQNIQIALHDMSMQPPPGK